MHKNGKTEHRGGRQYGYVRVSSREQNEARQLAAMCNAGNRGGEFLLKGVANHAKKR